MLRGRVHQPRVDVLGFIQTFVQPVFGHQRAVVTLLRDASVVEHQDPIRHCGNEVHVMTDHDASAVMRILADHAGQPRPLICVEILGRLVEQQHLGLA